MIFHTELCCLEIFPHRSKRVVTIGEQSVNTFFKLFIIKCSLDVQYKHKPSYCKDKKTCWNMILLSIKNTVKIEKFVFFSFLNNCFLIEEAVSHSEIICIEISIICMISILIVFFPK